MYYITIIERHTGGYNLAGGIVRLPYGDKTPRDGCQIGTQGPECQVFLNDGDSQRSKTLVFSN